MEQERERTRERDARAQDDEFQLQEREFEAVTDINEQMMEARDGWSPPEEPTYDPNSNASPATKTGIVRSIDRRAGRGAKEGKVRFGLDTGEPSLEWVEVEDTGEQSLDNEYVRLCRMYDVNPESVQDFYNKEFVLSNSSYTDLLIRPPYPVIGHLWSVGAAHHKYELFKFKPKEMGQGVVPTWRFFAAYVGALYGSLQLTSMHWSGGLLVFFAAVMMVWGVYAKLKYDIVPYAFKRLAWAAELYKHDELL